MNSSLANLGVKLKPIRSVNEKDSIQAVLQIFREFGGVCAVLNANGDLAGHFSPSDFRGLFDDNSCPLNASLFDFLSKFSPGSLKVFNFFFYYYIVFSLKPLLFQLP